MEFIEVKLPPGADRSYEVVIGVDVPQGAADQLVENFSAPRWAIISDTNVAPLYAEPLAEALRAAGAHAECVTFAAGEAAKTRPTAARLQDEMIELGLGRDCWVAAVGGGVVGDMAGFVAATLYRGLPYVQVPTTLLAMVDSSVGGKTGVDTSAGKNLVGAFLQPRRVLIDVGVLESLPQPEVAAGMAEVIKYGVILDADLFAALEADLLDEALAGSPVALQRVVARSCNLKAGVVVADETEADYRQILNFGHTVGHAIETVHGFGMRHGEAVAIGMVIEARLAARKLGAPDDLAQRIATLCQRAGLPTEIPEGTEFAALVNAISHDKKARSGVVHYALPAQLGAMACGEDGYGIAVDEAELEAAIRG